MELTPDMKWPPAPAAVTRSISEWDAWYSGAPRKLAAVYAGSQIRPGTLYGGLVGRASRMLWGAPPAGAVDTRIHLPLAADIASSSSDLLFGEELTIDWGEGNVAQGDRMEHVLDGISWQSLLSEAGELCSALGGVYLRAGWDTDVADHPLASVVAPDGALPTFSYGILREVTFWFSEEKHSTIYRHTETHQPGRIVHQLWKGTMDSLGVLVPLTDLASTSALADSLDGDDYILTGTQALTAVYVPNLRPTPAWRGIPEAQYLGRSDFGVHGVAGLLDAIDETWSSWMRDIRHGKSRILAASSVLQSDGPGKGVSINLDQEIYEAFKVPLGEDPSIDKLIKAQQFNIRVDEHSRTIKELTLAAVASCGYSGSTFGIDTEVAKTATEVGAVRGRTRDTREKKTRYWTPALERFLGSLSELDRSIFRQKGFRPDAGPRVAFPAFSTPTTLELAQTAQAMKAAAAASTQTLVQLMHPDWDSDQVTEEVDLISGENAPAPINIADPFSTDSAPAEPMAP